MSTYNEVVTQVQSLKPKTNNSNSPLLLKNPMQTFLEVELEAYALTDK